MLLPVKGDRKAVKRLACSLVVALWLFASLCSSSAAAAEGWISVRSQNFHLVGDASEKEIARVATHLEQFRELFSHLLPEGRPPSSVPLVIIVFKDDQSYGPFKPRSEETSSDVAGYFQSGQDVDYITLSADEQHGRGTHALAFHEYVHLLVKNSFRRAPLWLNEGLAEYYGTFRISNGGKTVTVGEPIKQHLRVLLEHELLPLETLFAVNNESPHYTKPEMRALYYAQSWALVHYLLNGNGGQRRQQVSRYLELLSNGLEVEDAFRRAFQADYGAIEKEFQQYVRFRLYTPQVMTFTEPLRFDMKVESIALPLAQTQFYLGDLLLHINQPEAAALYLQRAITLDANLAGPNISLGILRLRQNRFTEAKQYLERAVVVDAGNFLAHYYYAYVISRETPDNLVDAYSTEAAVTMRTELTKAIELAPRFPDSYQLLATVNLARNEKLDETIALINEASALWPDEQRFKLLLAEAYLHKEEFSAARRILEKILSSSSSDSSATDRQLLAQAQSLLSSVAFGEATAARLKARDEAEEAHGAIARQPCDAPQPGPQLKKLRFEGEQACGRLVRVECLEGKVMLFVEVGDRVLKLGSDALNHIRFVTYTTEARGKMECGLREPANPVLVTYRAPKNTAFNLDGEVIAVEFVPADWTQ
jgi:tetratricopeptide (TPR) repeat protein